MYPTRRMVGIAAAGIPLSLIAAAFAPGLWLIGVAWLFFAVALYLVDLAFAAPTLGLKLSLQTPATLGVARRAPGLARMDFSGSAPSLVELFLDSGSRMRIEPERQTCAVLNGSARAEFSLVPLRRGEGTIDAVWTRWQGPLGLSWRQRVETIARSVAIVPDIASVKDEALRLFERESGGQGLRLQLRRGEGAEFSALKDFQAGMDRRTIDWKQSARHGKLLAREFQAEENLHIVFALDCGRLMCEPLRGQPRIDRAIQALLLLAFVALRLGDRVGLFAFDEKPVLSSGTTAGPGAFTVLQRVASRIDYSTAETNFTLGLTQLSAELEHRSIIVVFTDFFDTTSAELMIENIGRLLTRHAVLFVSFRDEELESMTRAEPLEPADVSRAVLADGMLLERARVITRLKRLGVDIVDAPVEGVGVRLLETYLRLKQGRA
jgi:uncharacterized protein (DUF58 family)